MNLRILAIAVLVTLFTSCSDNVKEQTRPNVVLVLADDLGTGDVKCYNPKSRIPTPNLDKIANRGIRFTDVHTGSAVCTPTRYGIMTGRYCWRTRLKRGVLNGYSEHLLDPGRMTIASLLKEKGYFTAGIGKWHLGMDFKKDTTGNIDFTSKIANSPNVNGFDYFYGISASLDFPPYVYIENDHFTRNPTEIQKKQFFPRYVREGEKADNFHFETAWEHLLEKAVGIIDYQSSQNPFFLYFALPSPHKPVWPDQRFLGSTELGPYGDFVHQTDYMIGQILEKLQKNGIDENTLLIVTSDNGSFMHRYESNREADHLNDQTQQGYFPANHQANFLYRGTKADIWEAGHRVPFLVQWPDQIKGQSISENTICTTDFLATFADLLSVDLTDNQGEDSFSFLPILLGDMGNYSRAPVVNHSSAGMFAVRKADYKLVLGNGSGGRQIPKGKPWGRPYALFNLENDIGETTSILEDNQNLADEMEASLKLIIDSGSSRRAMQNKE